MNRFPATDARLVELAVEHRHQPVETRRVLRYDTRGAGMSQKVRGELGIDTMAGAYAQLYREVVA